MKGNYWPRARAPRSYLEKLYRRSSWFSLRFGVKTDFSLLGKLRHAKQHFRALTSGNTLRATSEAWKSIGPENVAGRVGVLALAPQALNTMYAGATGGGVWASLDDGASWQPRMWLEESLAIGGLAVAESDPNVVYAGTGEWTAGIGVGTDPVAVGVGVYRSNDSGQTWTLCSPISSIYVSAVVVSRLDSNRVYVSGDQGVHRSFDGGQSWTTMNGKDVVLSGQIADLVLDELDPDTLYAGVDRQGFYKSADGGNTWLLMSAGLPSAFQVDGPKICVGRNGKHSNSFILAKSGDLVFKSTDRGLSFTLIGDLKDSIYFYGWCNVVSIHPENEDVILAGSNNLHRSSDGGKTWKRVAGYGTSTHPDQQCIVWSKEKGVCYLSNDGGVWKSLDDGLTWAFASTGLVGGHFYVMSVSQTLPQLIGGAVQDDDGFISIGPSRNWARLNRGEGGFLEFDPMSSRTIYHDTWFYGLARSDDGGASWEELNIETDLGLAEPLAIKLTDSRVILAADPLGAILRSSDRGKTWSRISQPDVPMCCAAFSRADTSFAVVAGSESKLFSSQDSGLSWTQVASTDLPTGAIKHIQLDPTNSSAAVIAVMETSSQSVFRCTDLFGTPAWEKLKNGLPDLPLAGLAMSTEGRLFAACLIGVYEWDSAQQCWVFAGDGLPSVVLSDIDYSAATSSLFVGTLGMGVFEMRLNAPAIAMDGGERVVGALPYS
jgi:photosystem II stability/assembly factor-like uncharacterized protein